MELYTTPHAHSCDQDFHLIFVNVYSVSNVYIASIPLRNPMKSPHCFHHSKKPHEVPTLLPPHYETP